MSDNTVWVHGTSVQAAEVENANTIERHGSGSRIKMNPFSQQWLHFSIPTQTGKQIESITVDVTATAHYSVDNIHVYHGHYRLATFDDLNLNGGRMGETYQIPEPFAVDRAIGISVQVKTGDDAGFNEPRKIEFHAVGAKFS